MTTTGHTLGRTDGRIALGLIVFAVELVLRALAADVRRRLIWTGIAVLAVVLVSVGLVASAVRGPGGA